MRITYKNLIRIFFTLISLAIIAYTAWCGYQVHKKTAAHTALKTSYSYVNDIYYGLLSVEAWEKQVKRIIQNQITDFEINTGQMDVLRQEVDQVLHTMISKAEQIVQKEDKGFKGKLRKLAVNTFVDMDKLRDRIPEFRESILQNLTDEQSISNFKSLALDKLHDLAAQTYDENQREDLKNFYAAFNVFY